MKKIYLLTEERPKADVVKKILDIYCEKNCKNTEITKINIIPTIEHSIFTGFIVDGYRIDGIEKIILKIVSGYSSFVDYLLFESENLPNENEPFINLKIAIEETKTDSTESRNTAAGQRATKFAFLNEYKNMFSYTFDQLMLYNDQEKQNISDTDSVKFMKRCMKTSGVIFYGDYSNDLKSFTSIEELINEKNKMRQPPKGNTPIRISSENNITYISGTLSKPKDKGNIGHDPNIGQIIGISSALRQLGLKEKIIIREHSVKQEIVNKMKGNKFMIAANFLKIELQGIKLPYIEISKKYWKYQNKTEKLSSILLHMICNNVGYDLVYENHAGSERGYFYDHLKNKITVEKKHKKININLPDYVFRDETSKKIYIVEAEMHENLEKGIRQIQSFDLFENLYVKKFYKDYSTERVLCLSNSKKDFYHPKVIFSIDSNNAITVNEFTPTNIKKFLN